MRGANEDRAGNQGYKVKSENDIIWSMALQRLEIDGWKSGLRFSACHILPEHSKCSRMHGHTYAIHLRIEGTAGDDGLILDFSRLKGVVRGLAEELDHRLLIPEKDPLMELLVKGDSVKFRYAGRGYTLPRSDVVLLPLRSVAAESLSSYLLGRFLDELGKVPGLHRVELGLDEGPGQGAWTSRMFD
jgi:6-pyruvoyltetrahydropterin/6-carboxytetrahydropterin synthase